MTFYLSVIKNKLTSTDSRFSLHTYQVKDIKSLKQKNHWSVLSLWTQFGGRERIYDGKEKGIIITILITKSVREVSIRRSKFALLY